MANKSVEHLGRRARKAHERNKAQINASLTLKCPTCGKTRLFKGEDWTCKCPPAPLPRKLRKKLR